MESYETNVSLCHPALDIWSCTVLLFDRGRSEMRVKFGQAIVKDCQETRRGGALTFLNSARDRRDLQ
jgi:hypothetical protein